LKKTPRTAVGLNPAGYKRPAPNKGGPSNKRAKMGKAVSFSAPKIHVDLLSAIFKIVIYFCPQSDSRSCPLLYKIIEIINKFRYLYYVEFV